MWRVCAIVKGEESLVDAKRICHDLAPGSRQNGQPGFAAHTHFAIFIAFLILSRLGDLGQIRRILSL